jgi:N-acetylglucosaminyl-diphospho-decaprenol L-rhamnosyltransferase
MKPLGVVIVTYNSEAVIGACLDSLRNTDARIVVVDNASNDTTREEVAGRPEVTLLANPWNRGFAAAVNQGIDALDCPYVLLLNPDAELVGGLDELIAACSPPGVAAASGKLIDERGEPETGFQVRRFPSAASLGLEVLGVNRLWPGNPVNRYYRCASLDPEAAAEVEQPAGAFLLIKREVWRELGGFDERFTPLWFEDVDFCKRAVGAGYRIEYRPEAVAKHRGGHAVQGLPLERREVYWYGNLLMYAAKHFRHLALAVVCILVVLGSILRTAWGIVRSRSLKHLGIYGSVVRLAGWFLFTGRREGLCPVSALARR